MAPRGLSVLSAIKHNEESVRCSLARRIHSHYYVMCRAAYGGAGDSAESCWGEFLFISVIEMATKNMKC